MKCLVFSDVHESRYHCQGLVQQSENVDFVVGAGDFGSLRKGIEETIDMLSGIEKPCFLVPGNAESFEELCSACEQWPSSTVLHGTGTTFNGMNIFGIGGAIPVTPFGDWSYDFTEKEAGELLKNCPDTGILISHSPAYGLLDKSSSGFHLGSTTIWKTLEQKQLTLMVCGHIHESSGQQTIYRDTTVINAGPSGMIFDLATL